MNSQPIRPVRKARARIALVAAILAAVFGVATTILAAAPRSFLWKVSNGRTSVYLLGSVHMLTQDYYPLAPALDAAYKDADLLVEEVNLDELLSPDAQLQLLARGMLTGNQTIDQVLSAPAYAALTTRVEALGLPLEPLKRFKPWSLALTLTSVEWQAAGFDATLGLDKHFFDRARADGKPVQGLETADFQISRFDGMTWPQQEKMLTESLAELDTERANIGALAAAWKDGDAPAVEKFVLADLRKDPALYQRLVVDRNRDWLPKIDALFNRPGRALVVDGAAHLVGPDGLLASLRAKGYAVEQQ
jgi:uncharacterized protein YbaP (TraB family)